MVLQIWSLSWIMCLCTYSHINLFTQYAVVTSMATGLSIVKRSIEKQSSLKYPIYMSLASPIQLHTWSLKKLCFREIHVNFLRPHGTVILNTRLWFYRLYNSELLVANHRSSKNVVLHGMCRFIWSKTSVWMFYKSTGSKYRALFVRKTLSCLRRSIQFFFLPLLDGTHLT